MTTKDQSTPAILTKGLRKRFQVRTTPKSFRGRLRAVFRPETRDVEAVRDIDIRVGRGERVAFVGPNGAGKSTTIKLLSGILHPTDGHAEVLGLVPWQERRSLGFKIGTVFGQRSQLWYHLPAHDTFDLFARVYELDREVYLKRRELLVEAFGVAELLDRPVRSLSLGQRMRCEIVASLLHQPQVLFLDEPTIGLDVTAKAVIREHIRDCAQRDGMTLLLTSHDTGDIERVCDRVIVINDGRIVLDTPVKELRSSYIKRKLITLQSSDERIELDLPGVEIVERAPFRTRLECDVAQTPVEAVMHAALKATRLHDLTVEDPPMEEIIQEIYRESAA